MKGKAAWHPFYNNNDSLKRFLNQQLHYLIEFCIFHIMKSRKGFTLVQAIVVVAIVAILIAVGIPLYLGYKNDTTHNVAENTASSAASFLAVARTSAIDFSSKTPGNLKAGEQWIYSSKKEGASGDLIWTCPPNASITIDGNKLTAHFKKNSDEATSSAYSF
jgi:type II secretory pathway pseudopilin PulG